MASSPGADGDLIAYRDQVQAASEQARSVFDTCVLVQEPAWADLAAQLVTALAARVEEVDRSRLESLYQPSE